ncbi:MAG: hypothetical protein WD355_03440, partial [Balneolaceae bacterium]
KTTDYEHNIDVKLEAFPGSERWFFSHWEGNLTGSNNPEIVTVNEEKNITSVFRERCCLRTFGGSESEAGQAVIRSDDNRFVITGGSDSDDGDFDGMNRGGRDLYLLKTDVVGELDWVRSYGGSGADESRSLIRASDGGFVLAGWTTSNDGDFDGLNKGERDIFLLKTNSAGGTGWIRAYGGSGSEEAYSVIRSPDGGYLLTGWSDSDDGDLHSLNRGGQDAVLMKTNSQGVKQWVRTIGGSGPDRGFSTVLASDNGIVVAGWTNSVDGDFSGRTGTSGYDIFLAKFDPDGNKQWVKTYGGSGEDRPNSLLRAPDNGFVLAGYTRSSDGHFAGTNRVTEDIFLLKTGSNGFHQWTRTYGGSDMDIGTAVHPAMGGGYLLTGSAHSSNGDFEGLKPAGVRDIFLIKTDNNGNSEWIKAFGGNNRDEATAIYQEPNNGQIILTGSTASNSRTFSGLKKGSSAVFFLKLDIDGNLFGSLD